MTTTVAVPESPVELRELLDDPKRSAAAFTDKGSIADFMDAYAKKMAAKDPDVKAQVKEQVQLGMAEWQAEHGGDTKKSPVNYADLKNVRRAQGLRTSAYNTLNNPKAMGAKLDGIFEDGAEFFAAIAPNRERHPDAAGLAAKLDKLRTIQNSYGSEAPSAGGFLIPEEFRSQIMQVAIEESVTYSRATVIPMSSLTLPIPYIDDTSHVNSILGGVICYWEEEAGTLVESQASFGAAELHARKLTAYAEVPQELLDDAPAFSGFFDSTFPKAMAWYADLGYISGTGVGQPTGWLTSATNPAMVTISLDTGQSGALGASGTKTITWTNILNMVSRLLPTSFNNACFVANIDTIPELMTMSLPVGTGGSAVMIGQGLNQPGSQRMPMSILGIPLVFTEKVNSIGTAGDLSLVDLSYYMAGDRQQIQTANSDQYRFQTNKTAFRAIQRLDGRPWLAQAITPHSGSGNTLSAFVSIPSR